MTTRLQKFTALAAFTTLFYVGCGDDDNNETPGKGGSTSTSGGKAGSTGGGSSTLGGKATAAGGKAGMSGGTSGIAGMPTSGGAGGEPNVSPEGGGGGVPPVMTPEGGSGGGGGTGPVGGPEPCSVTTYNNTQKCYENCAPAKTAKSEQFLNHCTDPGVECTPFDNAKELPVYAANGNMLPPLP